MVYYTASLPYAFFLMMLLIALNIKGNSEQLLEVNALYGYDETNNNTNIGIQYFFNIDVEELKEKELWMAAAGQVLLIE